MTNLLLLIPAALALGGLGLCAFLWSLRSGQFDDLDGAAERILHDEPPPDAPPPDASQPDGPPRQPAPAPAALWLRRLAAGGPGAYDIVGPEDWRAGSRDGDQIAVTETLTLPGGRVSHVRCCACPIRERAVCAYCDGPALARLDAVKSYRSYAPGETILAAGEPAEIVGSVVRGVVTLTKALSDGRTQMVGLLFPSDFLGRARAGASEVEATAATDVTLCRFERRAFERALAQTPELERRLREMTADELDAARDWLLLLGRKSAREKVATFLDMLARRANPLGGGPAEVTLPLGRGEIADYLGLTIETVSRQMTALRVEGLIAFERSRTVRIPNPDALAAAGGD